MNVDNLNTLIAHLEAQPAERFNMGYPRFDHHPCGTAACISGHAQVIFDVYGSNQATKVLGLAKEKGWALFMPPGWHSEKQDAARYPIWRAISTLKRLRDTYLKTGEVVVDWGPEPSAGQPWSTPHVSEIIAPSLPAEITRLLRSVKVEA